jgi:hypothetical protein
MRRGGGSRSGAPPATGYPSPGQSEQLFPSPGQSEQVFPTASCNADAGLAFSRHLHMILQHHLGMSMPAASASMPMPSYAYLLKEKGVFLFHFR